MRHKAIKEIAHEFDLYLIEDACHGLGAEYEIRRRAFRRPDDI